MWRIVVSRGCMWIRRARQAQVLTPGTNETRDLAGSPIWGRGRLLQTRGPYRSDGLVIAHLRQVNWRRRRYKISSISTGNAGVHRSGASW